MLAYVFLLFLAIGTFGAAMFLVALLSPSPRDQRYIFPSAILASAGALGTSLIIFGRKDMHEVYLQLAAQNRRLYMACGNEINKALFLREAYRAIRNARHVRLSDGIRA